MAENKTVRFGQKLRGAVLIMVVTVMFMLIILLLATLTVVSTAQNRAYLKFEENQAYYTARSALDVFTQNILSDNAYYTYLDPSATNAKTYYYTDPAKLASDTVSDRQAGKIGPVKMKQGLSLEFEMYKIYAQNDAGFASNFKETDRVFGTSVTLPEDENYSSDPSLNQITYDITFPAMGNGTDDYGRFVDAGETAGTQAAKIIVTVEERHFNFGGPNALAFKDMTDAELKTCSQGSIPITKNGTTITYTAQQLKDAIRLGDRTKDKMRLKITSNVTFMGVEGSAVLYYDTSEKPAVNSSNAITSVSDISEGSGIIPIGGASSLSGGITVDDNSNITGSVYCIGDFKQTSNANIFIFKDTVHTIRGNADYGHVYPKFYGDGSIFYIDGVTSFTKANADFGTTSYRTNIVTQNANFNASGGHAHIYGNVFCNNVTISESETQRPTFTDGRIYTNYITFVSSINAVDTVDKKIKFNAYPAGGDITVAKGLVINGITYTFTDSSHVTDGVDIYELEGAPSFVYNNSMEIKITYNDPSMYTMTADHYKEFTLPVNLAGRTDKTFRVPTTRALYSQIFKDVAFVDNATDTGTNGDLNSITMPQPTIDYTVSYTTTPVNEWESPVTYTMVHPANGAQIIDGTINESNMHLYGYAQYYDANFINDKQAAMYIYNAAVEKAKTGTDPADIAYQNDLADYYANYISGAEKAGESAKDLLVYKSDKSPISVETINFTEDQAANPSNPIPTDTGATQVIKTSGYMLPNKDYGSSTSPIIIDARNNDITIQLGAENGTGPNQINGTTAKFRCHFVVIGDKNVKFYLPNGRNYYGLGTENASGKGFVVETYDIYKACKSGGKLLLGDDGGSGYTKAPNVFMYAGNDVEEVIMESPDSFFTGYIYTPFARYEFKTGQGRKFPETDYNSVKIDKMSNVNGYCIVGSIICKAYKSGNNVGVAYINQEQNTYTYGDTQFMWRAYQYTRN